MVALHVCQVWWTLAYKPVRFTRLYFRTSLANFLLSRPNSVEYGNCKTTTLLPSAKCTRPLFHGRTGCGGRPSGWHDIVTCQHLVQFKKGVNTCRLKSPILMKRNHVPFRSTNKSACCRSHYITGDRLMCCSLTHSDTQTLNWHDRCW